jgi:predicted metal-dependent hydrolase
MTIGRMKSERVSRIIKDFGGRELDAHYVAFFEFFNRQLFYEAHDVLEQLWLPERGRPDGLFYKGLIQLAGAFVHMQKGRIGPATALLKLAEDNLKSYPVVHHLLDTQIVLGLIGEWREKLSSRELQLSSCFKHEPPKLELLRG